MRTYVTAGGGSKYARLRLTGYYVQRMVTSRAVRGAASRFLIAALGKWHPERRQAPEFGAAPAAAMRASGFARLGQLAGADTCRAIHAWLADRPLVDARGTGKTFLPADVPPGTRVADYPLDTVVNCPHIMELANHPSVLGVAQHYLGFRPTMTGIGLRWSYPNRQGAADNVQQFHRDAEPGSIKLLVYLTDVDAASGPHHYVPGTHRDRMPLRLRRYGDDEVMRSHGAAEVIVGAAGTAFMIDAKGIHKGIPPSERARLVLVVEYALLPCLLYDYAPVPYRGAGRFDPYVNRLVIAIPPPAQRGTSGLAAEAAQGDTVALSQPE